MKIIDRCLYGARRGIAICHLLLICSSLAVGDGKFYAVSPALVADCGGELNAVLLQTVAAMVYGIIWACSGLIWQVERWSLLRQTATHMAVCSLSAFPIAYLMHWMPHDGNGVLIYCGFFLTIYFVIWWRQYLTIRAHVHKMNQKLQDKAEKEDQSR